MKTYNNFKHFKNIETLEELKKTYRELMMKHHPDKNPNNIEESTRISKEINKEYEILFELVKNVKRNKQGETYKQTQETTETSNEFMDLINELMKHKNITIDLVGSWLWVGGETKEIKEELKVLNFKYASNKKMWYYTNEPYKKKTKTVYAYDTLKNMFGYTSYTKEDENAKTENQRLSYN